jgi:tetratricopeptide (TPR) repeat protein
MIGYYGWGSSIDSFPKAREAAQKAIDLDPGLGEAYASLGWINSKFDWDWEEAERNFIRSIELNPSYATAHHWYAFLLTSQSRFERAIQEIQTAREMDPLSLIINRNSGVIYMWSRDYDKAIAALKRTIELDPEYPGTHNILGMCYFHKSMYEEALEAFETGEENRREINPVSFEEYKVLVRFCINNPQALSSYKKVLEIMGGERITLNKRKEKLESLLTNEEALFKEYTEDLRFAGENLKSPLAGLVYAKTGREKEAKQLLEIQKNLSFLFPIQTQFSENTLSQIYFALGDFNQGFEILEKMYEKKDTNLVNIKVDPLFDSIRSDPRYLELLKKMRLD